MKLAVAILFGALIVVLPFFTFLLGGWNTILVYGLIYVFSLAYTRSFLRSSYKKDWGYGPVVWLAPIWIVASFLASDGGDGVGFYGFDMFTHRVFGKELVDMDHSALSVIGSDNTFVLSILLFIVYITICAKLASNNKKTV